MSSYPWTIRPAGPDDLAFVLDTWCRSFRDSPWAGCVRNDVWHETQRGTIAGLLGRGAKLLVAVEPHSGRLMGYACGEPGILHYGYVKKGNPAAYRRLGVFRSLLAALDLPLDVPARFTHRTRASAVLLRYGWRWDPVPARTATP